MPVRRLVRPYTYLATGPQRRATNSDRAAGRTSDHLRQRWSLEKMAQCACFWEETRKKRLGLNLY